MIKHRKNLISGLILVSLISVPGLIAAQQRVSKNSTANPLATLEQLHADSVSLRLLKNNDILNEETEQYKIFQGDKLSQYPAAQSTAKKALDALTLIAIQYALSDNSIKPGFLWSSHAAREWFGLEIPGSQFGIDNPDNIYRSAILDSAYQYEIHVRHSGIAPIQESFELFDPGKGVPTFSNALAFVQDKNLNKDANGDYIVRLGTKPNSSDPNYLQITKPKVFVFYRNTLSDWSKQLPASVEIKRIGQAKTKPYTEEEWLRKSIVNLKDLGQMLIKSKETWGYASLPPNTLNKPYGRPGGWGFITSGQFKLKKDEAWVVKIKPSAAKYIGVQLTDPWLVSTNYIDHSGSLNNTQVKADREGNITYVVSSADPGVFNWLDTEGLDHGTLTIRWQGQADEIKAIDDAIIFQKVVKLEDIQELSEEKVTLQKRQQILKDRKKSYERRLGK